MSSCDCIDFDPPEAFRQKLRRARVPHRCCECRTAIKPGDRYQYSSGVWDGAGASFKTCLDCAAIREVVCECTPFGFLASEVRDFVRSASPTERRRTWFAAFALRLQYARPWEEEWHL